MAAPVLGALGQVSPAASINTTCYLVPSARRAVGSTLAICNTNASAVTYRVFHRIAGATPVAANAVLFDVALPANTTHMLTLGITLAATDSIAVNASSTGVTFTLWGEETDVPAA